MALADITYWRGTATDDFRGNWTAELYANTPPVQSYIDGDWAAGSGIAQHQPLTGCYYISSDTWESPGELEGGRQG